MDLIGISGDYLSFTSFFNVIRGSPQNNVTKMAQNEIFLVIATISGCQGLGKKKA